MSLYHHTYSWMESHPLNLGDSNNNSVFFDATSTMFVGDIDQCALLLYSYCDQTRKMHKMHKCDTHIIHQFTVRFEDGKYTITNKHGLFDNFIKAFEKINELSVFL